jgi:hypothetical protein
MQGGSSTRRWRCGRDSNGNQREIGAAELVVAGSDGDLAAGMVVTGFSGGSFCSHGCERGRNELSVGWLGCMWPRGPVSRTNILYVKKIITPLIP